MKKHGFGFRMPCFFVLGRILACVLFFLNSVYRYTELKSYEPFGYWFDYIA